MKLFIVALALVAVGSLIAITRQGTPAKPMEATKESALPANAKSLIVGGGCFWCIEAMFDDIKGVIRAENGYAGGAKPGVTYEEVCSGMTGHAEVIKIDYDPKVVDAADLLRLFFAVHDPTTLNRQGPDSGTQYRSVIFYADDVEKRLAEQIKNEIDKEKIYSSPVVTTIEPLKNYTRAEEYHQDYFVKFEKAGPLEKMKMNAGYCSAVIEPKVAKFRAKYASKLKGKG